MQNPIAFLAAQSWPSRFVVVALGLLVGWGAFSVTSLDVEYADASDASDVSRVELLR